MTSRRASSPPRRSPVSAVVPAVLLAVALAACSTSGDTATPTTPAAPTTTSAAPPMTTAASSTTTSPTTGPTVPEPQWTEEELEIIEVYEMFQLTLAEVLASPSSDVSLLREHATPELAASLAALVEERRELGVGSRGSVQVRPIEIVFNGDGSALLRVCRWGQTERIEGGQVVVPADDAPGLASASVVKIDEAWRVAGALEETETGSPCDL